MRGLAIDLQANTLSWVKPGTTSRDLPPRRRLASMAPRMVLVPRAPTATSSMDVDLGQLTRRDDRHTLALTRTEPVDHAGTRKPDRRSHSASACLSSLPPRARSWIRGPEHGPPATLA